MERLKEELKPRLVLLFGSFAEGDYNEGSDVDLLVVADFKEPFLDRIGLLMKLNTFHVPIEPIGYTPQEFQDMRGRRNPFILEVLERGKVLYGDLKTARQGAA
ncbi:MAG: nucleotidyltransferase domain-containing protein [Candidatus Bathyarchaeia archaeon]